MPNFGKALLILTLTALTLFYAAHPQTAPIRPELSLQSVSGALGGIFVIVLLIERATEIVISIWRQAGAEDLKQQIESLSKDPADAATRLAGARALSAYQTETKSLALLVGFSLSVVVCAAGVGLLATVVDPTQGDPEFLRGVDILLTSGLLAGGSDAFHQFTSALETFFSESKKKMAKPG